MAQKMIRGAIACALVALGCAAAKAQVSAPVFELIVNAPAGETTIECARGCEISTLGERAQATFKYSCRNSPNDRCGARIAGWL
jgi:hypothetical protein